MLAVAQTRSPPRALILGASSVAAAADEVRWRGDYQGARAEAARLDRPVVVVVASKGCGSRRRLEQTTLRDGRVVRRLNESTVPFRLDADDPEKAALVDALRVDGLPAVVVVSPRGRVVTNHSGYLDAAHFLHVVQSALDLGGRTK